MNIEWKKVTWYSQAAAVVLFVAVFALGIYLGTRYNAPAGDAGSMATSTATSTAPVKSTTSSAVKKTTTAANKYAAVVSLTASGFVPKSVQVRPGQTVHFVNTTSASMRIYSTSSQQSPTYKNGFDQLHSVGKGGTYDFLFNDPGVWTYYNLNGDHQVTGTVTVQ